MFFPILRKLFLVDIIFWLISRQRLDQFEEDLAVKYFLKA